jgi:hypothetical protein
MIQMQNRGSILNFMQRQVKPLVELKQAAGNINELSAHAG